MAAACWRVASGSRLARILGAALGASGGRRLLQQRRPLVTGLLLGAGVTWYSNMGRGGSVESLGDRATVWAQDEREENQSIRKKRFTQFASLVYEAEHFMTPRDFLLSVTFESVPHKLLAKGLTKQAVDAMLGKAATTKPGSSFFRLLDDQGLISYTEYVFLLTILTKPQTGFNMAFKMLDTDDDEQVEKKEFFKLQKILSNEKESTCTATTVGPLASAQEIDVPCSDINTSLLVHFFGRRGTEKLQYSEFERFIKDLQTEIQEMEFIQFSKGMNFMRKEDFAEWLLFFTDEQNNDIYWKNVRNRISAGESISLDEFKHFYSFMNNLEDFSITMQMFSLANRPVKLAEFMRAVKVATGEELSKNVLDTVFKIFDIDGDNCLSHGEFLGVLKNRLHRGLKQVPQQQGLKGYWKCVKREMIKGAKEAWKQTGRSPC